MKNKDWGDFYSFFFFNFQMIVEGAGRWEKRLKVRSHGRFFEKRSDVQTFLADIR